jgi:hypothetical protein
VVGGLISAAPEEAGALACSLFDDSQAFAQGIEGFVLHGSDAEPHLFALKEAPRTRRKGSRACKVLISGNKGQGWRYVS